MPIKSATISATDPQQLDSVIYDMVITLISALNQANCTDDLASQRDGVYGALVLALERIGGIAVKMHEWHVENGEILSLAEARYRQALPARQLALTLKTLQKDVFSKAWGESDTVSGSEVMYTFCAITGIEETETYGSICWCPDSSRAGVIVYDKVRWTDATSARDALGQWFTNSMGE